MVDAAVVFRQPVAFVAARGEVVLAFVGADGEFLFAAVEGDVAPARYGEDVREADAVGVVGFFGNRQGLAAFAFGEFGDFFGGDEGDPAFVTDGEDVRLAVRLAPPGVMRVLPLLVLLVSSAPGMRKP